MTLALDPKVLAAAHAALKGVIDRKNTVPVCAMYHLAPAGDHLVVTATDMDMEFALDIEGRAEFDPVCLPPYLVEAGADLRGKEVTIEIDERRAVFKAGRSRFAAQILPGSDFPRFAVDLGEGVDMAGDELARLFEATVTGANDGGDGRFYLEGVFLRVEDERLHATATDGHRLHTTSVPAPEATGGMMEALSTGIIVPTKACREIAPLARKAGANMVRLQATDTMIAVRAGGARLTSKLVDGTYPDWRRVVPQPGGKRATVDLAEVVAALDRVRKVQAASEAGQKKLKTGSGVKIAADGDYLTIAAKAAGNVDEAVDGVAAEFEGDWPALGVSGKYLRETLADMKERGADTVMIDVADPGSPIRIESPTDEDFLAVIMPMRV